MFEILAIALWTGFSVYSLWYLTLAKHYAPITPNDAKLLWKVHKQTVHCDARKWRKVKRGGKTVGFECECGYKHIQQRPIVASMPTVKIEQIASAKNTGNLSKPARPQ